jgi:hypothetical protein
MHSYWPVKMNGLVVACLLLVVVLCAAPASAQVNCSSVSAWSTGQAESVGTLVTYGGHEFKCLQAHTSQVGWEPPNAPALWSDMGACNGGATPTPTSSGGSCAPSTITPFLQVGGGSWSQMSSATVAAGSSVTFGPQPVTGGSWRWSGPGGYSSTARQITVTINSASTYVATYTNSGGCKSTQAFTVSVASSASWVTVLDGSAFGSASALWAGFSNAYPWGSDHNGSARMLQQNVSVSGGALVLTAQRITDNEGNSTQSPFLPIHYHSGTVYWKQQIMVDDTTREWTLEGDLAVPSVKGTWPAFWLTAVNGWPPELDILEFKGNATCWQNTFNGDSWANETVTSHKNGVSNPGAYHHYKIWLGKKNSTDILVDYYIDGAWKAEDTATNYVGKPMWLILDLQMEGSSGTPGPTTTQSFYAKNLFIQKYQ